ncbi:MAG TPA: sucrase ferredoxin [Trebonia sp.]|jgi:hypothetical protein
MRLHPVAPAVAGPVIRVCEHGTGCHEGTQPALGTAPEAARSWLLIEHDGPWPEEAADAALPGALAELAARAGEHGVRVQLIRRPGRRPIRAEEPPAVFVGWTAGSSPWLRRGDGTAVAGLSARLAGLAEGSVPAFGSPVTAPLYLVCAHGRRDVCCARLGGPLARELAAVRPAQVWETTHVGGHRYAANLVILPHGLYYGPVDPDSATAAIAAYDRGEVIPGRYRGRAGQPKDQQAEQGRRIAETGTIRLSELG